MSSQIANKELSGLCRRLATALEAGIDARRVWSRESLGRGSPALKRKLQIVSQEIQTGASVTDALARTGKFFPPLFLEMAEVGEQTGNQPEIFRRLADHYEHQVQLRRQFLSSITWPLVQLVSAIVIIGLLILVMGMIPKQPGIERVDILGWGLMGFSGFVIYMILVGVLALGVFLIVRAIRKGLVWTAPIQRGLMKLPVLGPFLQVNALSRMAWTLSLTLNTSLDLRKVLALALRSAGNARYTDHTDEIVTDVAAGMEIHEAFVDAGVFRDDFLDTVEVSERSGQLPEAMAHLSADYQDQARRMMSALTVVGGFLIWALIAIAIISVIFRIASLYIGTINDLLP